MSDCIYHEAESVTICPSCDFAVCQQCVDGGVDGVCAECSASNANRAAQAAAVEVPRCKYCRLAEDDETPLDVDGYCETCAALPRCQSHSELIAFDACKTCRQQYCRKCLGLNNVCEACTAKQAAAPPRPKPAGPKPGGTAAMKAGTGPVKRGTGPVKKGTGPTGKASEGVKPKRPRPPEAGGKPRPGAPRRKGEPELDEKGRPKKRPPSRGAQAMEAKLQAGAGTKVRKQMIAAVVVVGACALILLSGWVMRASSAEESSKVMQEQMVTVHKAVLRYYKAHNRLPANEAEIKNTLKSMSVPGASRYKISVGAKQPSSIIFELSGEDGFLITGRDAKGDEIKSGNGAPVALDQFFDSGL